MGGVHLGALRVDVHVDLAAHAEAVRQIDPRLDRETHARYERARVFRFEVVDVRPGAVQLAIDRMARAMHEVVGEPGVADHGACDVIHLGSCHRAVASSMRRWTPVSRTSAPRAASLPIHASASRATRARISAALRWPASSAADQRAANRDTSGADDTSRAPKDSSSWTTPCGTRSR